MMQERRRHPARRPIMATIAVIIVLGFFAVLGVLPGRSGRVVDGCHHFTVKNRFFSEAAMEGSTLTISPIHHWGNGQAFGVIQHDGIL